jgi:hypothetical protein
MESILEGSNKVYIVDFLNIFSDFREVVYKSKSIDFHKVKDLNKEEDTINFFKFFFTKYSEFAKIDIKNSQFIFILKKIINYSSILEKILQDYSVNIKFLIINTKSNQQIIDKNKDDFLCQYLMCYFIQHHKNSILISNDLYRDRSRYIDQFHNICLDINILTKSNHNIYSKHIKLIIHHDICNLMISKTYSRCSIQKHKLYYFLS